MNQPQTPNNEIARLRERLEKAEYLIRGLHDGWKKARTAHLETCKNAQAEINKIHTENQKLRELCDRYRYVIETEFDAWSIPCRGLLADHEELNQLTK
jgi:hypothetical protein